MSDRSKTRLYFSACVCLLLVAAALRFYDLPGKGVWGDDARAANNSLLGGLEEVIENTRNRNSSPILYPLVLYVVQKVESSPLSIRIVPAIASVLTIVVFLILLPSVGVSRWAAFIAALLSTGSFEAMWHGRGVREYSIDAFLAALMIVGLLSYIRRKYVGGTYVLLCVSLFVAPLLQYGLVLFGIAVLGTIAVIEGKVLWNRRESLGNGLHFRGGWVWNRVMYLAGPAASFAAGCAISYATTFRHHWDLGVFAGPGHWGGFAPGYYLGEYSDVPAMIWFVLSRTEALFRFHLTTDVLTTLGLGGIGIFLIVSFWKARLGAITILFLISLAVAVVAGLILAYPYGGLRQCMYLAPIVLLASGHALHSVAVDLSRLTRRAWLVHLAMVLIASIIALSGTAAVTGSGVYRSIWQETRIEHLVLTLEEQEREGDVVYVESQAVASVKFYHKGWRDNYCYGSINSRDWQRGPRDWTRAPLEVCTDYLFGKSPEAERMWLMVTYTPRVAAIIETLSSEGEDIQLVDRWGVLHLYLWTDPFSGDRFRKERSAMLSAYQYAANNEPAAQFVFDVYMRDSTLIYVKDPCVFNDLAAKFFLHLTPTNVDDLPDDRRQYGFDNLDFEFFFHGMAIEGKCVAVRDLPEYDIQSISTGQFREEEGSVWEGHIRLGGSDALLSAYEYAVNSTPAAQSVFDVYVGEGKGAIYIKEPCVTDDVDARFFLHVTPTDPEDLSDARKEYGFDNLDFGFSVYGVVTDGRCIAVRDLPEYGIRSISTGQFDEEEGEIWRSEFRPRESTSPLSEH